MSRAQKPRQPAARNSNHGSTLIGVFVGLVIGVLIAAALAWYFSRPYNFQKSGGAGDAPQSIPTAPIALPGKPGDKPVEKPADTGTAAHAANPPAAQSAPEGEKKFDFYDILPKGDQATLPSADGAKPGTKSETADRFFLQLGAFADPSEVDNLKARLALMGVEATVQRVDAGDKGTLHRVRIGPYAKPEDMNAARAQLAQAGIESSVVKVKPSVPAASQSGH
ncbi:hypothetical protein GCM10025771_06030 [Niveibacterium umoris]|uniref:Cell division protein FtsN n=1 Tax=Niveibacterium umoris TaxID=1193620 RepID=A0A840BQV8_9RHOO|nr:SPOR domain-containing protein [Niveibacterium umoris]MBB4013849.1 cell division protein FtsN [Niveibacterium umoris]